MKKTLSTILIAACLFGAACAKRGMPSGGPPDTTPPFVEALEPGSGSTEVGPDAEFRITFSESMKKRTVETGVVVSPPVRWLRRYWEDNTYVLVPQEDLVPNTTYLVSVTNKAADSHGLKMKSTFVGGFSTGVVIDAGRLSGKVAWKNVKVSDAAVVVFDADTLLIGTEFPAARPVYLTLTGEGGLYEVPFVDTTRTYWVLAFMDKNANAEYDESEVIGCFGGKLGFEEGGERQNVDIILCKETFCGSVKGSVDSLTLSFYPQVGVEASSTADTVLAYQAICDGRGAFRLTCVEPGPYRVGFYADVDSNSVIDGSDSLIYEVEGPVEVRPCFEEYLSPPVPEVPEMPDTTGASSAVPGDEAVTSEEE
jgi:hypothetical protein